MLQKTIYNSTERYGHILLPAERMSRKPLFYELCGRILEEFGNRSLPEEISSSDLAKRYNVAAETVLRAMRLAAKAGAVDMGRGRKIRFVRHAQFGSTGNDFKGHGSALERLSDTVKHLVAKGELKVGYPLPKSTFFQSEYRVSSHTVTRAFRSLEKEGVIYKRGKRWLAGRRPVQPKTHAHYPSVICVLQLTPHSFGELLAHGIWEKFANTFVDEALSKGIQLQTVLFDSSLSSVGSLAGRADYVRYVKQLSDRYLGTLVVCPRSHIYREMLEDWIPFCAGLGKKVVWLCTTLAWPHLAPKMRSYSNAYLSIFGEWETRDQSPGMVGTALESIVQAGHTKILFLDTFKDNSEWITERIRTIHVYAEKHFQSISITVERREQDSTPREIRTAARMLSAISGVRLDRYGSIHSQLLQTGSSQSDMEREVLEDAAVMIPALLKHRPTAIIAPNDLRARRYFNLFHVLGISVPRDISLISFDNAPYLRLLPISSIDFGMSSMGYRTIHTFIGDVPNSATNNRIWAVPQLNHYGSIAAPRNRENISVLKDFDYGDMPPGTK